MANVYTVPVKCNNCNWSGPAELPRGTLATPNMECPNCGCKTANTAFIPPKVTRTRGGERWITHQDMPPIGISDDVGLREIRCLDDLPPLPATLHGFDHVNAILEHK